MNSEFLAPGPSVSAPREAVQVARLLDEGKWSGYLKFLILLTALTIIFDGADNQLLGIAIPSLMREWSLPRSAFAPLLAVGMLGMIIGGGVGGLLGDRLGRKSALLGSVALFGVATLGVSAADSVTVLGLLRFVAGLGLGGAMPNAAALASEYVPRRQRPIAVTLTIVCIPLGGMLAAWMADLVLPAYGWRGLFVIGGVAPLLTAAALTKLLVESPRFLARQPDRWPQLARFMKRAGHPVEADAIFSSGSESPPQKARITALFTADFRRDTLGLWMAFFSCLIAVYANFYWIPSLLSGAGLGAVSSRGLLYFNLGGVAGAISGALVITWIGSRPTLLALTAAAILSAVGLSCLPLNPATPVTVLLVMLAITGGMINAVQTTMYSLAAHVYPVEFRATGVGTALSFGRIGGLLSVYIGAWAMEAGGSRTYFLSIAAALVVTFIGLSVVRRHIRHETPAT